MKFDEDGYPQMAEDPRFSDKLDAYGRGFTHTTSQPQAYGLVGDLGQVLEGALMTGPANFIAEGQRGPGWRTPQEELPWSASPGYPVFGALQSPAPWAIGDETPPPVTEEDIIEGGVLTPPPDADPSEKIKAAYENRSRGIGNPNGQVKMPQRPSMKEQSQRIQQEQSKQLVMDQTKVPKWHESNAINVGLLSMGLNLLAGNDIATAFNQGAAAFEKSFGVEKRAAWAEDLRAYGYDDLEIQKYIETGDNKVLTDPMERKRQARRDAMEEAKLRQLEHETSPEMQQYLLEKDQYTMGMQQYNAEQAQANADRAYALQEAQFMEQRRANKAREDAAAEKATGKSDKVQPRDAMLAVQQLSTDLDKANRKIPLVGAGVASAVKGVAGDEFGSDLLFGKPGWLPGSASEAQEIRTAQNQFVENGVRLATGAVVRDSEQSMYRNYLFPQGDEFNDPKIVARKRATQDFFNQVARNVAMGKTKEMDPIVALKTAEALSKGSSRVLRNPETKEIVALQDLGTGYITTF